MMGNIKMKPIVDTGQYLLPEFGIGFLKNYMSLMNVGCSPSGKYQTAIEHISRVVHCRVPRMR